MNVVHMDIDVVGLLRATILMTTRSLIKNNIITQHAVTKANTTNLLWIIFIMYH